MKESAPEITVDGQRTTIEADETILQVARRLGRQVPTLCDEPRLEPAGVCRMCLVEVEGSRRLIASCRTPASAGMQVTTDNERIQEHRRLLLGLYLTDHPSDRDDCEDGARCELHALADTYGAPTDWPKLPTAREGRPADENPFILYRADRCIVCERCVRYCDEVEGVSAITVAHRGSRSTISTAKGIGLLDSSCELCGGCVDVCPTGAMAERMPLSAGALPESKLTKVRTTCNYCGVGCQMDLNVDPAGNEGRGEVVKVTCPPAGTLPNDGNLCVKGRFAYDFIDHPDRLTTPQIRGADGALHHATWDEALDAVAAGLGGVKDRHGADALAFISSSRCTIEENYLVQKIARAVYGTNNVHQCAAT